MRTRLEVCCIASADEARLAVSLGADVCSGVRTNGALDARKLEAFSAALRSAR